MKEEHVGVFVAEVQRQAHLAAGDAVEADRWRIEAERQFRTAERQFKTAIYAAHTASALQRHADAGPLWVDSTGRLRFGPKPN